MLRDRAGAGYQDAPGAVDERIPAESLSSKAELSLQPRPQLVPHPKAH